MVPLGCFERTTIGFRLQKLELHFNPSVCSVDTDRRQVGLVTAAAAAVAAKNGTAFSGGGVGSPSPRSIAVPGYGDEGRGERVSVVLLTRDRYVVRHVNSWRC